MAGTYRSNRSTNIARGIGKILTAKPRAKVSKAKQDYAHKQAIDKINVKGAQARKTSRIEAAGKVSVVKAKTAGKVKTIQAAGKAKLSIEKERTKRKGVTPKAAPKRKVAKGNKW